MILLFCFFPGGWSRWPCELFSDLIFYDSTEVVTIYQTSHCPIWDFSSNQFNDVTRAYHLFFVFQKMELFENPMVNVLMLAKNTDTYLNEVPSSINFPDIAWWKVHSLGLRLLSSRSCKRWQILFFNTPIKSLATSHKQKKNDQIRLVKFFYESIFSVDKAWSAMWKILI